MSIDRVATVLGNLSIDHVDGGAPTPGGAPSFAGVALESLGARGRIVTRAAPGDLPLFEAMLAALPVPCALLPADATSAFGLRYDGDARAMSVEAIGPRWTPSDVRDARIDSTWVHVAPLLRTDFTAATIGALAESGHLVGFDGQGLVRRPALGPMAVDADFEPGLLRGVTVLKLAEDEAAVLADGEFGSDTARALGVPEILVTNGSAGSDLYVDGGATHVPVAWPVAGTHSTGAGDMFTTTYVVRRALGEPPAVAAHAASRFVAERLQARLSSA